MRKRLFLYTFVLCAFLLHSVPALASVSLEGGTMAQKLYKVASLTGLRFFSGISPEEVEVLDREIGFPLSQYFPEWRFFYHELVFARNTYIFVAIPREGYSSNRAYILGFRNNALSGGTGFPAPEQIDLDWRDFLRFEVEEVLSEREAITIAFLYAYAKSPRDAPVLIHSDKEIPMPVRAIADTEVLKSVLSPPHIRHTREGPWKAVFTTYETTGNLLSRWAVEFVLEQYEGYISGYQESIRALVVGGER